MFIGEKLDHDGIKEKFDQCLLTDSEMKKWERIMKSSSDMEVVNDKLAKIFEGGRVPNFGEVSMPLTCLD